MVASRRRRVGCQGQGWQGGWRGRASWSRHSSALVTEETACWSAAARPACCPQCWPSALGPGSVTLHFEAPVFHSLWSWACSTALAPEKQDLRSVESAVCCDGIGEGRPSSVPRRPQSRGLRVPVTALPPVNDGVPVKGGGTSSHTGVFIGGLGNLKVK